MEKELQATALSKHVDVAHAWPARATLLLGGEVIEPWRVNR
jgi:hypothetical protein